MYKANAVPAYTQNEMYFFNTETVTCNFTVTCEAVHTLLDIPPLQTKVAVLVKLNTAGVFFSFLVIGHPIYFQIAILEFLDKERMKCSNQPLQIWINFAETSSIVK